jgi:hypothetical protein
MSIAMSSRPARCQSAGGATTSATVMPMAQQVAIDFAALPRAAHERRGKQAAFGCETGSNYCCLMRLRKDSAIDCGKYLVWILRQHDKMPISRNIWYFRATSPKQSAGAGHFQPARRRCVPRIQGLPNSEAFTRFQPA